MKVKNIMFFGFAAAILSMGAANAAATATFSPAVSGANEAGRKIVSSKAYVDSVASNIAGQLKSVAVTGSYTDLDNKPTLPTAAQSGTHITTSTDANNVITVNVSDITDAGTGIDSTDTGLTTGKAVYEYVHSNPESFLTDSDLPTFTGNENQVVTYTDTAGTFSATTLADVATSGDYTDLTNTPTLPTAAQSGTHITTSTDANNVITVNVSDITDAGTGIDSTDTGLTTGKAVYEYVHSNPEGYATATDMANHKQVPAKPSSCTNADPCVLMETADGYGWFHMATDVAASQTGTQQASASLTTNVAEQ